MKKLLLAGAAAMGMSFLSPTAVHAKMYWQGVSDTSGVVKVAWTMRDGSCRITYGPSLSIMPHETVAPCSQGTTAVGGLEPGKKYVFQVRNEGTGWSEPVAGVAKHGGAVAHTVKGKNLATYDGNYRWVQRTNGEGWVRLYWAPRSGSAQIHYTEANQRNYKYSTVVDASKGETTVGKLVEGRKYKFHIAYENNPYGESLVAQAQPTAFTDTRGSYMANTRGHKAKKYVYKKMKYYRSAKPARKAAVVVKKKATATKAVVRKTAAKKVTKTAYMYRGK